MRVRTGIDIVEVRRVGRLVKNARFLKRVFTPQEVAYCRRKKISAQHFAVRFAAKEAVWKALGQSGISHRDIGVVNAPDGAPQVVLKGRKAGQFSLSLSHTRAFAVAVAVYCGR